MRAVTINCESTLPGLRLYNELNKIATKVGHMLTIAGEFGNNQ